MGPQYSFASHTCLLAGLEGRQEAFLMNFSILSAKPSPGTLEELATHLSGNWRTNIKDHEGIWGTLKQQAPDWPPYNFSLLERAWGLV